MIKPMMAVMAAAAVLAACQPAPKDGISLTEKRLAEKIVDAGVLMPLDKQGLQQIAFQQVQGMMMQDGLQPQEARQVMQSLSKSLETSIPEMKQKMVETLAGEFNVKELELLLKLVASKEGKAINEKMQVVGEKTSEQLRAHVEFAGAKALADVRKAWPTPPPPAPPAPPAGPGGGPGAGPGAGQPIPGAPPQ